VLNEKLKEYGEKKLGEYECGFRPNRSTTEQIFIIRQILEKHIEHGYDLYLLFVDFKQAFDSVNRKKLIEVMNKMGIPHKIIRMVEMTMNHTKAKAKIRNKLSETFEFSAGVKQGDGLSAVLFILALHHAVNKIDQRGTIFTKSSQICAYADDIVIVTRSKWRIIQMYEELEKEAEEMGLRINEKKTKYMVVLTSENRRKQQSLKIVNKTFEGVNNFVYLGNIIDNENRINA
jgi:sorting nexin-29